MGMCLSDGRHQNKEYLQERLSGAGVDLNLDSYNDYTEDELEAIVELEIKDKRHELGGIILPERK